MLRASGLRLWSSCVFKITEKWVPVPINMTNIFQSPVLTVKGSYKAFLRKEFRNWFAELVQQQIQNEPKEINVDLKMSILKLTEARCLASKGVTTGSLGAIHTPNRQNLFQRCVKNCCCCCACVLLNEEYVVMFTVASCGGSSIGAAELQYPRCSLLHVWLHYPFFKMS